MSRIPLLPKWALPPTMPSVYEMESATALEMTSKLYGAMQKLIEDYNAFIEGINTEIKSYTTTSTAEIEEIRKSVEQRLICQFQKMDQDFAALRVELMKHATDYIAENVQGALPVVSSADDGKLLQVIGGKWTMNTPTFTYDPETESLNFNINGGN